jgi:starch synthase
MLTREWPPEIYGGAGVHVEQLVSHLRARTDVRVYCFGSDRDTAEGFSVPLGLADTNPALQYIGTDLLMAQQSDGVDLLHSHTWYTNLAGHIGGLLHEVPHVVTAHSLEPRRPWKLEQLGGGYRVSSWIESSTYQSADAIIAVSAAMRADLLTVYPEVDPNRVHVIHNGIDTDVYRPTPDESVLHKFGVTHPYVLFVGRITRQKGIVHLINAMRRLSSEAQLVLCASSPDSEEIGRETEEAVAALRADRGPNSVVWIREHVSQDDLLPLLTGATVFACPSIYEPLGIVNLEAMACETAVVASDVGGIPEVVANGVTGLLVPYDPDEPQAFPIALADTLDIMINDPQRTRAMGAAGRARAVADFSWSTIAEQTITVYSAVIPT